MEFIGRTVLHKPIIGEITFIHNQTSTSNTWVITHNLHRFPSVTVVNRNNVEVKAKVTHNNDNQVTITFAGATAGKAYFN